MPYRYLDEMATADVAFQAEAPDLEALFITAAEATVHVMIDDLTAIRRRTERRVTLQAEDIELLLFQFLQEFVFFKDAEGLLLLPEKVEIVQQPQKHRLKATVCGEVIDRNRHDLIVDIKAVTLHRFRVTQTDSGWETLVVLDI